jgi:hypothetical protein
MSITENKAQQASRPHVPAWLSTLAAHPLAVPLVLAAILIVYFFPVLSGAMHFWEDVVYFDLPNRIFNRDAILSGQFPFWNPYSFGGMPFFATFQTGSLYIYNILLSVLPVSNATLWYLVELGLIVHLWVGGMGMYLLARTFERSRSAALFAAIAFMLCGFLMLHLIHVLIIIIVSLTPLVMALLLKGCRTGSLRQFALAGLVLGGSIFAGHPQVTLYQFIFLGSFCIYLLCTASGQRLRLLLGMAMMFVGGVMLSLVQLLPAMELVPHTVRTNWSFEALSEGSLSLRQLLTFLMPKLFGGLHIKQGELAYWLRDSFHNGYWTYWETGVYLGVLPLLLGFIYLLRTHRNGLSRFALVWIGTSLLIAMGSNTPLLKLLYDTTPGFDMFRIPSRILYTWALLLPIFAAFLLDRWRNVAVLRTDSRIVLLIGGLATALGLFVLSGAAASFWPEFSDTVKQNFAQKQAFSFILLMVAAATVFLLYQRHALSFNVFAALITALCLIDLFAFGRGYHTIATSPTQYFARFEQATGVFRQLNQREPLIRLKTREGGALLMDRNQGMIEKFQTMEGYAQLNLFRKLPPTSERTALDLMGVRYAIHVDTLNGTMGIRQNPTAFARATLYYNARSFDDDSALVRYLRSADYDHRREVVLEQPLPSLAPLDSAAIPQGSVEITHYKLNRLEATVTTDRPAVLLLSEIYYPDWKTSIDGKAVPILRANYCQRAVEVPAGTHSIRMYYSSNAFLLGLIATLIALAVLSAGAMWGDRLFKLKGPTNPLA